MRKRNCILKEPTEILEPKNTMSEIINFWRNLTKRVKEAEMRSIETF